MVIKKILMKLFLMSEMFLFCYLYFFGTNGIKTLQVQHQTIGELLNEIKLFEKEIDLLNKDIYDWQTDDFYKEKVAREQLQMARPQDKLFYIDPKHLQTKNE